MTSVSAIAAVADNGVIGKTGAQLGMPWRIKSEFRYFKAVTLGHPVVMGRKSFEALGAKPLPGRVNVIITRDRNYRAEGALVAHTLEEGVALAKEAAEKSGGGEIFICGGAEIYRLALPLIDRLYLTEVHLKPEGDILFPPFNRAEWEERKREFHKALPGEDADYTITVLERK